MNSSGPGHEGWLRIQLLFEQALQLPEAGRKAYIQSLLNEDPEVISTVAAMVENDCRSDALLDISNIAGEILNGAGFSNTAEEISVRQAGPYSLLKFIGEGGMGVVYLAEQTGVEGVVAVKFLLHSGLSPERRRRFTDEIKFLRKLNHSSIARLHDAGVLNDGTPWFAMDYVQGECLPDYCQSKQLAGRDVLGIFRTVCQAVVYAHGKEIIHRDLKPSNILVDARGEPRLLDFGIAKELQLLGEKSHNTRTGLRLLTPEYAAPEWVAEGTVGLFTDVYSLGIILHELLTGLKPKPGAAITQPSRERDRVSGFTRAEWNDLDCIYAKAAHFDVTQRYQSVESLIRDLDHLERSQPLEAQPPSWPYRIEKFISRHRTGVIAAAASAFLLAFIVSLFTVRLAAERNTALAEIARTRQIRSFMLGLFGAEGSDAAPSKDLKASELLRLGVKAAGALQTDPETQAQIYLTLGDMYRLLSNFPEALRLKQLGLARMKRATGADSLAVAQALAETGCIMADKGQYREAEKLAEDALTMAARHAKPDSTGFLRISAAAGEVWSEDHATEKARAVLQPLTQMTPRGAEETLIQRDSLSALGDSELYAGLPERSLDLQRRSLAIDQRLYGRSHPRVARDLANIGAALVTLQRNGEAETIYRRAIEIDEGWYGPVCAESLEMKSILGGILIRENRLDEAGRILQNLLADQVKLLGENHPDCAYTLNNLGFLAQKRNDLVAAEGYLTRGLHIQIVLFGERDFATATAKANLALVYRDEGRLEAARNLLRQALDTLTAQHRPDRARTAMIQATLGDVLVKMARFAEAGPLLEESSATLHAAASPDFQKAAALASRDLAVIGARKTQAAR